jgi:hypothetical protein
MEHKTMETPKKVFILFNSFVVELIIRNDATKEYKAACHQVYLGASLQD